MSCCLKSRTDLGKADPAWIAYSQLHKINEKHREFNIPTYIAFNDLKKRPLTLWTEANYGLLC
jgi:hypothetical protein